MQIDLGIPGAQPRTEADIARVDKLNNLLTKKDQLMVEVRKHLRLSLKPHQDRVTLPDITDRFNHTRTKQKKPTVHSFVTGRNVRQLPAAYQEERITSSFTALPFGRRKSTSLKTLTHEMKDALKGDPCSVKKFCSKPCLCHQNSGDHPVKLHAQDTLNGCRVNKQLERLQVPSYPLPQSKLDYQKNYFTCIKDRPLKERFKRSELSKMQRTAFFKTLMTGYIKDDISRRKEQLKLDMYELERISQELDLMKKMFKKFIEQSNEDSVTLVKDQLQAGYQRDEVEANLSAHKAILSTIKVDIFKLENKMSTLQLCRELLLKLSPSAWRNDYEHQARHYTVKTTWLNDLSTFYNSYLKYYPDPGRDFFLHEAMEYLVKEVANLGPPNIYFTESWQISMVLRRKELECIYQIGDIVNLERRIAEMDSLSKELTKFRKTEMKITSGKLDEGRAEFEYQKKRVAELKAAAVDDVSKYVDVLNSGDIMLETLALIEVLYSDILCGKSKQTPDPIQMMIEIEKALRLQRDELTEIAPKVWRHFERKVEAEERKQYKAAMRAKRVYREVKVVVNSVREMFAPPPRRARTWKIPIRRSMLPTIKTKITRTPSKHNDLKHYQLNGILTNDDLEESISNVIKVYLGLPIGPNLAGESEDSNEHSSISSNASTESLQQAIYDQVGDWFDQSDSRHSSASDPAMIEIGYDSDEELIRQNYEKKKGLVEEPPVMYDAKILDDRFMVEDGGQLAGKRRRSSRKPCVYRNNPLSWR